MPVVLICKRCGKEKDKIESDGTRRCSNCRKEQSRERRAKKRAEKGLRPIWRGPGENPICPCGELKENSNLKLCYSCKRKQDNEWRLRTGRTKRHRTGKCRCGNEFASFSGYQCIDCYRKTRGIKRFDPDYKEQIFKENVRAFTRRCIKIGILIKEPCRECGTNEDIEAHHEDYTKPLDVIWFCRNHHREHHKKVITKEE